MAKPATERRLGGQLFPMSSRQGNPFIADRLVRGVLSAQQECEFHRIAQMLHHPPG